VEEDDAFSYVVSLLLAIYTVFHTLNRPKVFHQSISCLDVFSNWFWLQIDSNILHTDVSLTMGWCFSVGHICPQWLLSQTLAQCDFAEGGES
jgi:hypothetical protein